MTTFQRQVPSRFATFSSALLHMIILIIILWAHLVDETWPHLVFYAITYLIFFFNFKGFIIIFFFRTGSL